jgi:hypothetical protein
MGVEALQRGAALGLVVAAGLVLGLRCARSPEVTWVWQRGDAAWITVPQPVDAAVQQFGRPSVPVARYVRRVTLDALPEHAELRLRAARAWRVRVNGDVVASSPDPDPDWRRDRIVDVASALQAGENEVAIEVWNARGPPLLRARLALPGAALASGPEWSASWDGSPPAPATLPDDTRAHPSAAAGPRPARALGRHAAGLAGLFLVSTLICVVAAPRLARRPTLAPPLALGLVALAWIALFATSFTAIPLTAGFDATNHLRYVELLREKRALPLPGDGWSTFHPPLYYGLAAALQTAGERISAGAGATAVKLLSFAAGLGQGVLAAALAAALVPGRPFVAAVAALFAGCLPLNLYMAAYVSNEPLHAFWFGLATLLGVRVLSPGRARLTAGVALGAALGLALVTKVTALVAAALAGAMVLAHALLVERARPARLLALALALAVPIAGLAGWFYLRNLRLYGTPLVVNWDLPGMQWWSQPGFHTLRYYVGFGTSLELPVFSGFRSFADSLYSSFWGDGWVAGRATAAIPPEWWHWGWAAIGYWLALPATALLVAGVARSLRIALVTGPRRAAWSFVLALEGSLFFVFLLLTLDAPYFGQAKAPYLLGLVAPLAVQFALGVEAADRWLSRRAGAPAAIALRALTVATGAVFWRAAAGP